MKGPVKGYKNFGIRSFVSHNSGVWEMGRQMDEHIASGWAAR